MSLDAGPGARDTARAGGRQTRVLHLINGESYAGAERVQDLLGERLPEFGVVPTLVALKPRAFRERRHSRCELIEVSMKGRFDLRPAWQLAMWQRERRWDLVHTHTPRAALIGAVVSRLTGLPLVHHVHSPTSRDTEHPLRNFVNCRVEGWALRGARRVLAVSPTLVDYLQEQGVDKPRIRLVMNGVPTPGELAVRPATRAQTVIGCMALFRPRKGLEVLLHAVARMRPRLAAGLRLRIVGGFETPTYEEQVRRLAEELGLTAHIDWRGFRSDVNAELETMDVFVLPSLYGEGMPMVLLEAMAVGLPCVASAVEGIPTTLDDGRAGLLFAPGDADTLAERLDCLLDNAELWRDLRARAYDRQRTHFSDVAMARHVSEVYAEVLAA